MARESGATREIPSLRRAPSFRSCPPTPSALLLQGSDVRFGLVAELVVEEPVPAAQIHEPVVAGGTEAGDRCDCWELVCRLLGGWLSARERAR
jgi:hypothetical protein